MCEHTDQLGAVKTLEPRQKSWKVSMADADPGVVSFRKQSLVAMLIWLLPQSNWSYSIRQILDERRLDGRYMVNSFS